MTKHNKLSARAVAAIGCPGRHSDGNGLYIYVANGGSRSWIYLFAWKGKQREMGLGSYPQISLAIARDERDKWRQVLRGGRNPIEVRRGGTESSGCTTFGSCTAQFLAAKSPQWSNAKHRSQWRVTLETHAAPLRDLPVDQIGTEAVLAVLKPLWQSIPETASRLRGRIEAVLDFAKARGWRTGENPAAWRGHLALLLAKPAKSDEHHAAMDYADVPAFVTRLVSIDSVPARALEFVILTAGRRDEIRLAAWSEIDLTTAVWTIPANRMKTGKPHRVPLCDRTRAIIEEAARYRILNPEHFVFQGRFINQPIGENAMAKLCPSGATTHGFRSAFRDWCGNETSFPREIAEQALAHSIGNATEAAYRRSDALERRRVLMEAWASYCTTSGGHGNMIPIRTAS